MLTHFKMDSARVGLSVLKICGAIVLCAAVPHAAGVTVYDESISGDLSNSGLTATPVSVGAGLNEIYGTTGRDQAGAVDRDYFTISIPAGLQLAAIAVLPGTTTANLSFIGMESGTQVTLPSNTPDAVGLLGWTHYSPDNGNILPDMAIPAAGSAGFDIPLGAGDYAFWVQELSPGAYNYGFDFQLQAVPETGPGLLGGAAAMGCLLAFSRRRFVTA